MNWNSLTVEQAQKIDLIRQQAKKDDTNLDVNTRLLSVVLGKTEEEIDSLPWGEYLKLSKQLDFLERDPEGEPVNHIKVNGRRYRCVYDVKSMPSGRYIEGKTFNDQGFMANLHRIAASMVTPQKRTWYGRWVDAGYNASEHIRYSNDMLQAPFIEIHQSCLFFYHVYRNWMEVSRDYLIQKAVKAGNSQHEAERQVSDLCRSLDGIIPPKLLPIMKG